MCMTLATALNMTFGVIALFTIVVWIHGASQLAISQLVSVNFVLFIGGYYAEYRKKKIEQELDEDWDED